MKAYQNFNKKYEIKKHIVKLLIAVIEDECLSVFGSINFKTLHQFYGYWSLLNSFEEDTDNYFGGDKFEDNEKNNLIYLIKIYKSIYYEQKLKFYNQSFNKCNNFKNINFSHCEFNNCSFEKLDLAKANFQNSIINKCDFIKCSLIKAKFNEVDLKRIDFDESELTETNIENCIAFNPLNREFYCMENLDTTIGLKQELVAKWSRVQRKLRKTRKETYG